MPKMFIHAPKNTFTAEDRAKIAAKLSELGLACERLMDTPQIRAGIWVYFAEHDQDMVFRAGKQAAEAITSLKVYALKGGFDAAAKSRMVVEATAILGQHSRSADGPMPVYVVIIEIPEANWGMYGQQVHLEAMQIK